MPHDFLSLNRDDYKKILRKGTHAIKFNKKDGSIREAIATLDFDLIPEKHHPSKNPIAVDNDSVLKFYSVEDCAWRSALVENLIEVAL